MKKIYTGFLKKSVFLCLIFVLASTVYAGVRWTVDGVAISTASGAQYEPTITSDGDGGAIITWYDSDIYAQRINSAGVVQWTTNGVDICTEADIQSNPTIVSDGAGGAIITWQDKRGGTFYDIYAQRINSAGVVQWTANGEAICTEATQNQYSPTIVSDGAGGAIIIWEDMRSGNFDIYARRINSAGNVQWTADGEAICTASNNQRYPAIVSDGAGGAIITWYDERDADVNIYAQRIDSAGDVQWTANGKVICQAMGGQYDPAILSDGAGGAIITWDDHRGADYDIYAQWIDSAGDVQWTADGEAVCIADNNQEYPTIISDGAGGAIITWDDYRNGSHDDIYAQRINSAGAGQWATDGEAICTAVDDQEEPMIVSDGDGGAIITWYDSRSIIVGDYDIYAQRINSAGNVQWTDNGEAISTAEDSQSYPTIVSDGTGGAIITWYDDRNPDTDIYAQRISNDAPQATNITPDSGPNDGPVDIANLAGTKFFANATVKLTRSGSSAIQATDVVVVGPTKITCRFDLTSKEVGRWNVVVTNTDEQLGSLSNGFEVTIGVLTPRGEVKIQGGEKGYANPSKGEEVKVHFQAKSSGKVTIKIYTLRGQLVWEDSKQTDGEKDFITWDCQNSEGSVVSSGIYIIYVEGPGIKTTKKAAILK
ncbi:hypothetical protein ES705_24475 [subsurface metagenome]